MSCDDELRPRLSRLGLAPGVQDAALAVDATMQRWRRRVMKREVERRALADMGLELDLPVLDVLLVIAAPEPDAGEMTVGAVAQRLGLDPSRASRLVADAIARGHARRAVSQDDARRTIVELTALGRAVVLAVRSYKVMLLGEYLSDWKEEEIAIFTPLLERFSQWSDRAAPAIPDRFAEEVAGLVADLAKARED